jgi:hypothetical protein
MILLPRLTTYRLEGRSNAMIKLFKLYFSRGHFVVHGVGLGYQARSKVRKGRECNAIFKSRSQVVSRQAMKSFDSR